MTASTPPSPPSRSPASCASSRAASAPSTGSTSQVAAGRDLRLPRPQRRRQDDLGAHPHHAAAPDRGRRARRRPRRRRRGRRGAARDRRRAPGGGDRPADDRPRAAAHAGRAARPARRASARARAARPARARRPHAGRATGASAATRAACAAGSTSRSRSCTARASCSSTSRRPGLDPTSRGALWREVRALNDEGTTVFLTTQYLEEAEQLADRVGIIAAGRLVAEGTPDVLKARVGEPTLHVELADPDERRARARGARRARRGASRRDPARRRASRCAPPAGKARDRAGDPRARRARTSRSSPSRSRRRRSTTSSPPSPARTSRARPPPRRRPGERDEGRVVAALGRRALTVQFRRAQLLMPTFVLPLMLLAVIASGTSAAQDLPRLPRTSTPTSASSCPGTLIQGALLAGLTSGHGARRRHRVRLLRPAARRAGAAHEPRARPPGGHARALRAAVDVLPRASRSLFGARYPGGVARRPRRDRRSRRSRRSGSAGSRRRSRCAPARSSLMQSVFPFVFVLLFTAPAFFPRELLTPALRDVAAYNPLTYVVEAVRGHAHRRRALGDPLARAWSPAVALAVRDDRARHLRAPRAAADAVSAPARRPRRSGAARSTRCCACAARCCRRRSRRSSSCSA